MPHLPRPLAAWPALALAIASASGVGCGELAEPGSVRAAAIHAERGRAQRERDLLRRWAGRTRGELQREWGEPSFMLNVPGGRTPSSYVMVFVDRDQRGGCIDAFVVLQGNGSGADADERIWTYICR